MFTSTGKKGNQIDVEAGSSQLSAQEAASRKRKGKERAVEPVAIPPDALGEDPEVLAEKAQVRILLISPRSQI